MAADASRRTQPARADLLTEMVELSSRFGADPAFVRAGGGNISAKADGILAIKPSGVSLATLTVEALIELSLESLLDVLEGGAATGFAPGSDEVLRVGEAARRSAADGRRPSVELLFHALLPESIVLHTHPTTVNTLTCSAGGGELAAQILGERALWIPYADPGMPLARLIRDERSAYEGRTGRRAPRAILLQNHGLIVSGDTANEIEELSHEIAARIAEHAAGRPAFWWGVVERIEARLAGDVLAALRPALGRLLATDGRPRAVAFDDSPLAVGVAGSVLGHRFAGNGPLTPDQIVYAGSWPLVVEALTTDGRAAVAAVEAALAERTTRDVDPPVIVLVAGLGLFAVGDSEQQAETARELYLDAVRIASGAHRLGGVRPLAPGERQFIERWEAEAYRRQVASRTM
ncbi:MAG TPA: class II aldolase/adducin family protein [Candidatus Limnocylindrales bacterium]|jgi:rhamnose utilization protein RhaD (predicted bifunctional aldolase and dehydrogenase)